jgi:hypothetical protein
METLLSRRGGSSINLGQSGLQLPAPAPSLASSHSGHASVYVNTSTLTRTHQVQYGIQSCFVKKSIEIGDQMD